MCSQLTWGPHVKHNLGLDPGGVEAGQLLLSCRGDQDVAVSLQNVPIIRPGPREAHDGAVVLHQAHRTIKTKARGGQKGQLRGSSDQLVVLQLFGVDPLRVVDGAIDLSHANTLGSKPVQVPHGVKAHVPEALRADKATSTLASSWLEAKPGNPFNVFKSVASTEPRTLLPPCGRVGMRSVAR